MKIFSKGFVEYTEKRGSFTRREAIEYVAVSNLYFSPNSKLNRLIEHAVRAIIMVRNSHKFLQKL